jgi:hypothetical protein
MVRGGLPNIQSRKRPGEVQFLDYSKHPKLMRYVWLNEVVQFYRMKSSNYNQESLY